MRSILTLAVGFGLIAGAAFAQSPDAPLKGRDTDPALPPPNQTIPDKIRPSDDSSGQNAPGTNGSGDKGTLSDRLEKSDGVIKPPGNAAPGMVVTPPDPNPGGMPVIKPGDLPGRQPGTEAR
ncbi:hypothetical protein ASF60_16965 [Methylobacterium sp. Leaf113]|uniref:hypothetical protein n=1 Tax=Methylobacterium sp. Leaf113 TaxID=1736259 RepID=UPI0006F81A47|nr:hypothetical protein [Methylobacterium sp. Leaf113]KQP92371.1 hypothetical protein ASF60_16965 [Methylobacterium sp. Leaf113]